MQAQVLAAWMISSFKTGMGDGKRMLHAGAQILGPYCHQIQLSTGATRDAGYPRHTWLRACAAVCCELKDLTRTPGQVE
jgi:hypothetical protein